VSSDLIYDVLGSHEPGRVLPRAAWADAATGLPGISRLGKFLERIEGRIRHNALNRVSTLAAPVMLEIGREPDHAEAREGAMREAAVQLIEEAMRRGG